MSSRYQYTTMDRVFAKIDRDLTSDFSEDDVIEWTGEALEFIGSVKSYEEAVCFVAVKNHQCYLPKYMHAIIQMARDNNIGTHTEAVVFTAQTKEILSSQEIMTDNGELVTVNPSLSLAESSILLINYSAWIESTFYRARYVPIHLKTSNFFDSIVCKENHALYHNSREEYTIKGGNVAQFSFKEGLVAIAYLKQQLDPETGWPMVPDHVSHLTAIGWYVNWKMAIKAWTNGRQGAADWMNQCEKQWDWYCKQASNVDMMPFGDDEHQNMLEQRSYLLPRNNKYYGFFGNLARPEHRVFNNPTRRNNNYY